MIELLCCSLLSILSVAISIQCVEYNSKIGPNVTEETCKSNYNACSVLWGDTENKNTITQKACWIDSNNECGFGPCIKELLHTEHDYYFCCCKGDFCNKVAQQTPVAVTTPRSDTQTQEKKQEKWFLPSIIVPCTVSLIALLTMVIFCIVWRRQRHYPYSYKKPGGKRAPTSSPKVDLSKQICSTYGVFPWQLWHAERRTSRRNSKHKHILSDSRLSVRVSDRASAWRWSNETKLLSKITFSHPHIVSVVWWGPKHGKTWLLLQENIVGTLARILQTCTFDLDQVKSISEGIANGLSYLHCTIHAGSRSKPAISHRDIRPDNIMMKNNYIPVLGNFHCAVRLEYNNFTNLTMSVERYSKLISTNHYLAPELFTNRQHYLNLNSYKQMDIYSTSLVMWQILNRCVQGGVTEYSLPYENLVGCEPSLNDMSLILPTKRPILHTNWKNHQEIRKLCYVMQQCWSTNPEYRFSAHYLQRLFREPQTLATLCGNVKF